MVLKIADRGDVPAFMVMDVMQAADNRAAQGKDVLHLEVGQPATPAPRTALEAAKAAMASHTLGYTVAVGIPALRERIATWYQEHYGVAVDADQIIVTQGSSGGFQLAFLAAFNPGDRVALANPSYPAYRNILKALSLEPVEIPALPENGLQPTPELLEQAGQIDGLIVASPANPTGAMLTPAGLTALTNWCSAKGVRFVSDEIYHGISYGKAEATAATDPNAIVVNSFSKYFSMTGWRLGWLVVPQEMVRTIECLQQNLSICAPAVSQYAGVGAFDGTEELAANLTRYAENREILVSGLAATGLTQLAPADGAFYIYAGIEDVADDAQDFCKNLLEAEGVAITPGLDFDPIEGSKTVRLSFAGSPDTMREALIRLKRFTGR